MEMWYRGSCLKLVVMNSQQGSRHFDRWHYLEPMFNLDLL